MKSVLKPNRTRESRRPEYLPSDPLITAAEAAIERGQGLSTFWRDVKNGVAPSPYYVGPKTPRWRRSEIRISVDVCKKHSAKSTMEISA